MKQEKLEQLKKQCIEASSETIVFGEGSIDAQIVLVGEAPGAKEVEQGKPFVGQAGKNLDEFLKVLELERDAIYITNVVKIRPYKVNEKTGRKSNRPPSKEEVEYYKNYLLEEIQVIQPKVVVTLGNVPLKTVLKNAKAAIGEKHGIPVQLENYYVFPLYHPASIIYRQELKKVYREDLEKLKEFLKGI
ncbi:uracil-DNA glycosylase [Geosporobacter ferrireducens]|uniref:Type-4 uracil-DNA glycosylase n=1 Tax=Geosporobacter ferrireducens TaxID=1424294 RepID=A0A1D8GHQ0_9FIRM|nr:uracil-DNA glycosylase [Geosporobacter ferrireducens]AOT70443.1 uracil-DNA glycosylase [Geosporobacter ferrireducens]MTI57215.1 uracil-DNA glycosylase [Geosporobacter ferrireducens]